MTENRTSLAVEELARLFEDGRTSELSNAIAQAQFCLEFRSIAAKYRRMEEALERISSLADGEIDAKAHRRISVTANEALVFDPLSPKS